MAGTLLCSLLLLVSVCFREVIGAQCKITSNSTGWPAAAAWKALNTSVSGRLLNPVPPGAVCQSTFPEYDNAACAALEINWYTSAYHLTTPATVDYNDDTCIPQAGASCSAAGYPTYVIAAENTSDVQAGVKFAARTGVRLIVKGTGHDYLGRSSGPGSLSIWTHNIRGITFDIGDKRVFNNAIGTVKIAAGMTVGEILQAAAANNVTVVTGSDPTVGIGGWLAGGGHGPVTSRFGLGADQVVEMEVVTATGQFLTINNQQHQDLFWAMRGGGGSSFAIMVSATVLVYPNLPLTWYTTQWNTSADSDTFWDMATVFHSNLPTLSESGVMGYYYVVPNFADNGAASQGGIIGAFLLPEKSISETQNIFAPLEKQFASSNWSDPITTTNTSTAVPGFAAFWETSNPPLGAGQDARLGSRLLNKQALTANLTALKTALQKAAPARLGYNLGNFVAGPGPRNIQVPGGNAVIEAWRETYVHYVVPVGWQANNQTDKSIQASLLHQYTQALVDLAPDTGAYMSESDPTTTNWQQTFWAAHYPRLLATKAKWDPLGVFFCITCVGSELWSVTGGDAIGQDPGQICRRGL